MRVLVAEDSSLLRTQMTSMCSELGGIEVVGQEHDAFAACIAINDLKPDVVILDILMRRGNGIEVLKKIRCGDCFPVVIVLSHNISLPYRKRSRELGAEFFLDKSMEFGTMREIVQRLIQRFNGRPDSAPEDFRVSEA